MSKKHLCMLIALAFLQAIPADAMELTAMAAIVNRLESEAAAIPTASPARPTCQPTATAQAAAVKRAFEAALAQHNAATAQCSSAASRAIGTATGGQLGTANNAGNLSLNGAQCARIRQQAASAVATAAATCNEETNKNCGSEGQTLYNSCTELASASTTAAATNGFNAGNMLDNALKATQIASMLGQMMGQQGQQKPGSGVSAASGPPTPQKVDLSGGKSGLSSNTPGFGLTPGADGKSVAGAGKGGAEGFTPFTMPKDFHYEPPKGTSAGAGESGVTAIAGPGGSGSGSAGGLGGGGAGGTGASMMPVGEKDKGKDASDLGAFEFPTGGGGRSSGFLGLKSKGDELGDLAGGGLGPLDAGKMNSEFPMDDRGLASVGEQGANDGINDDGTSLFNVVGTKLREMKKRGSI